MRKRNAKILGISLALMLVMCVATTLLSFSLADETPGTGDTTGSGTSTMSTTKTNIDYIIDNSLNGGKDESGRDLTPFYIVEVGSAANSNNSPLAAMVAEDKLGDASDADISQFVKQVINGWSTEHKTMVPNKISYEYISVSSLGSEDALNSAITAVSKADLVYVSNDPNNTYTSAKDIPEDLKMILSGVATTNYTPFIIDSPTKTANGGNGGGTSAKTYTQLANKILASAGYYRNAFSYNTSTNTNVENYLNRLDSTSLWLPIYGSKHNANWYTDDAGSTTARVLTIQSDAADNAVTNKVLEALDTTAAYDLTNISAAVEEDGTTKKYPTFDPTGLSAYVIKDTTAFYNYGYSTSDARPDNLVFETIKATDITEATDLTVYDLIIVEKGVASTSMSDAMYNKFSSLVYGLQHILYDSTINTSGQGENPDDIVISPANNYQYIVNKVADSNEKSRFSNVLVTGMSEMKIYAAAAAPSGVKAIADIINNGSYRGSGGGGSSSNLYTVLEVQPCYPIDIGLGKALKNRGFRSKLDASRSGQDPQYDRTDIVYYINTFSVLNGVTSDEISFDGGKTSLSDMESTDSTTTGISARGDVANQDLITEDNAVDYYAWELSKAKVAHLTGLPYNKVNVVHMSSVEFNTSRETLLDNYDAIYIGGKNTAIKDVQYFAKDGRGENAAVYNMYFHNGGTYSTNEGIGVLTGNDITYNKFVELQKYVKAGMPVIFTKPLADAYYGAKANKYNQTLLDPESNVYKLMALYMSGDAPETATNGDYVYPTEKANVLAGFDPTDQVKIPNNGDYGTTYGGYVTVFGGTAKELYVNDGNGNRLHTIANPNTQSVNAEELSALLLNPNIGQRPKFSLLQTPASYVEGDITTEIVGNQITFKFDIAPGPAYSINVYVDDNTNSRFEDTEKLPIKQTGNTVTATYANSFDGAMYWKFEIVSGDCRGSVTGLSKVKVKTKNYVNVLQITPEISATPSDNSKTMLLFCTECQQAKGILKGNRYNDTGKYDGEVQSTARFNDTSGSNYNPGGTLPDPATYDNGYVNVAAGKTLGIHQHNFGIVKYDGQHVVRGVVGTDDWTTNWCYDVLNDYDMDIELLTTRQFEAMVADAMTKVTAANFNTVSESYKSLADIYKNYYMTMRDIINGVPDVEKSTSYTYLKNKLTKTDAAFVEADLNMLFGEEMSVYNLETAKGGFHVTEADFNSFRVAQKNLDSYLTALAANPATVGDKTSAQDLQDEIVYEKTYHRYSDFFSLSNAHNDTKTLTYDRATVGTDGKITTASHTSNNRIYTEFSELYVPWRNAKIYEQYFYKMYTKYLIYSSIKEFDGQYLPDLTEVFSCIVIGVAEHYGNDDINTQAAIDTLKAYIQREGNTFIFHQTIDDTDGPNMTNNLRTLFGQNYSHITTKTVTETGLFYDIRTANSWEKGSATSMAAGSIKAGQGLDIQLTLEGTGELIPTEAKVTPNNTGRINISYTNTGGGNWSNKRVWVYINNTVEKYEYSPADHTGATGTLNNVATVTEGAITSSYTVNESPSDTNRYHYTALLKNGKSIAVSPLHRTQTQPSSVRGNAGAFGRFDYTQTGLLWTGGIDIQEEHVADDSDKFIGKTFTTRATQTNKGVVTLYPFLIGSELKISGTHPNTFSTDIEDDDMVVYYALAGGEKGTHSSVAAADPKDGIDNYFLYSYGNVTYCGAGHSLVTGYHRDNNDERRLFINIILNSSKKSVFGPTIEVFDPYPKKDASGANILDEDGNPQYVNENITQAEDGSYEMVVPNTETIPEFTYKVTIPDAADEVSSVMIYYDLSPNASNGDYGFVNGTDVLIFQANAKDDNSILKNKYKLIDKSIEALKLKPNYFQPYDNKYTYIVIAVKTKKGVVTTQRIMVKIAPKLWDLT